MSLNSQVDADDPNTVVIFTDGSCYPNPSGNGGWAFYCSFKGKHAVRYGHASDTTNNAMELTAILKALQYVPVEGASKARPLVVFTDSKYCQDALLRWLDGWRATGWKTSNGSDVKNRPLLEKIDKLIAAHSAVRDFALRWVRGHSGIPENEMVDRSANNARLSKTTNWKRKDNKQ